MGALVKPTRRSSICFIALSAQLLPTSKTKFERQNSTSTHKILCKSVSVILSYITLIPRVTAMIRCHLARMMGEHKLRIADVARETGLSRATVTLLYKETAQKVDLNAIKKICVLFDCTVGELLELVPSPND